MLVHARPRTNGGQPEVAFVAGRRVGGAVQRNRAKRRLRAAARDARLPEADLVVDARSGALDAPFDVLRQDLERLSRQAVERAGG
jgi:ribonuclease P protein component